MQEMVTPGRRLWINHAGTAAVEDGDVDAHVLLCTETDEIPATQAAELGIKNRPATNDKQHSPGRTKSTKSTKSGTQDDDTTDSPEETDGNDSSTTDTTGDGD